MADVVHYVNQYIPRSYSYIFSKSQSCDFEESDLGIFQDFLMLPLGRLVIFPKVTIFGFQKMDLGLIKLVQFS